MNQTQRDQLLDALRHGHTEEELEDILADDVRAIEPLINTWIRDARNWYFPWVRHRDGCGTGSGGCSCGLLEADVRIGKVE